MLVEDKKVRRKAFFLCYMISRILARLLAIVRMFDVKAEHHWHATELEHELAEKNCVDLQNHPKETNKDFDMAKCIKNQLTVMVILDRIGLVLLVLLDIHFSLVAYSHFRVSDYPVSCGGCPKQSAVEAEVVAVPVSFQDHSVAHAVDDDDL